METTTTNKRYCAICNKERGIFKCDGCSEIFCLKHTADHHKDIVEQFEQVEEIRDVVQKILLDQSSVSSEDIHALHQKLSKTIDEWEQKSINEIQKVAEEARNELVKYTTGRMNYFQSRLEQLNHELQQSRANNDFIETDLRKWEEKLKQLKEDLINPPNVTVQEDYTKMISKLRVIRMDNEETFERSSGNADFEENGKVVYIKNGPDIYTEVRGQCEYFSGQHRISMKVEKLNGWILFGIISKPTSLQIHSYVSPSCYGWYNGMDFNYAAGQNIGGPGNDVLENDIVHLVIDCDKRLIQLTNERINQTRELAIDITNCPFPWQLHLNLNQPSTRIRILSSTKS